MNDILLFKDNSIKLCKNIQKNITKNFNNIKYILFLADTQNETFILQKPKEFMKKFHKASITFESLIIQHSNINEETSNYPHILHKISKDILSLTELYSYLHSLNRIRLWNKLSNSNECAIFELIEFSYFELTIKDIEDNILFRKKMDVSSELGKFGEKEIVANINQIYSPVQNLDKHIIISDYNWRMSKKINTKSDLCGVYLPYTKSIAFLYCKDFNVLCHSIKSVYYYTIVYNNHLMTSDDCHEMVDNISSSPLYETPSKYMHSGAVRFQDLWTMNHSEVIEIIVYLYYLNSTSIIVSELNDYGEIKDVYATVTQFQIELFGRNNSEYFGIECDNNKPVSISDILNILCNQRRK